MKCDNCDSYESELGRCNAKRRSLERTLAATTAWLEKNQPDVFRRGLWDAITAAAPHPSRSDQTPPPKVERA